MNYPSISAYYHLIKPRVTYGNVLTTAAGFLFASNGVVDLSAFLATVFGTTLVIASACVLNNYYDQDIDKLMKRTKNRPIVKGQVSNKDAICFSVFLIIFGSLILLRFVSMYVFILGLVGFFTYVYLYGNWGKRTSLHGTLIGAISGAIPIFAGYAAVKHSVDLISVILFAVMFFWQLPAFYSIAVFRKDEYKVAGVPVISVVLGVETTKKLINFYLIIYIVFIIGLAIFGNVGIVFKTIMPILSAYWIYIGVMGLKKINDNLWALQMFQLSLMSLLVFSVLIAFNDWLP